MAPIIDFAHAIAGELRAARALMAAHGPALAADPALAGLLADCRHQSRATWAAFDELGVSAACSACAARTPGGCCFPEVGLNHQRLTLLANLLLGVEPPERLAVPGSCHFVGPTGCRLTVRDSFCINYFCPGLERTLGPAALARLLAQAGRENLAVANLEQALARRLRAAGAAV